MRTIFSLVFVLFTACAAYAAHEPLESPARKFRDTIITQRGWVMRCAYNHQDGLNGGEFGFGRMARFESFDALGRGTTTAAASFTFGADVAYDTSLIAAPKLAMEFSALLIGARVGYGYYLQDGNASGVIILEGGLNIFSRVFVYAGYNFVKRSVEAPVIAEGLRFSAGFNYPFGMRRVAPPKRPDHL